MLKFCPSPHEIQMLLGFPFNAAGCHTSLLSRHRLSVWSGETRAREPHKGCCWRKLSNSWHKDDIRGQRCGLAAPWALVQVVSSSSGALRSTAFLNLFQSIFLVHPMEQSLRAFPRTYLALTPLEFYYSFVKGDDSSQSHVMLLNLHVKIVVYP